MSGSFFFFGTNSSLVCRLWRAGRSVSVTGNRRTGSAASARGASHLYYEYQAGSRSQDLCLHQHPAWVISRGFRGTTASHWWLLTESCSCFRKTLRSLRTVRMCFFCLFVFLQNYGAPSIMWRHEDGRFTFWTLNVQKHVRVLLWVSGEHGQSEVSK